MTDAPTLPAGYCLVALDVVDSTNDEANRQGQSGAPTGTVIWALEQTRGRGRRGRTWLTARGNLAASILLRPSATPGVAAQISFVASLAVLTAVEAFVPPTALVRLKWPNDVLVGGRKISGILLEATAAPAGGLAWLVVGTGINLRSHPEDTETPATDLLAAGAGEVDPAAVLERYCAAFARYYRIWEKAGFEPIGAAWLARAADVGEAVRVRLEGETLEGRFQGLDSDGALVLELAGGIQRRILAGDVFSVAA